VLIEIGDTEMKKSAARTSVFTNTQTGKKVETFSSYNSNTGAPVVWLKVQGQKTMRFTGKNIAKLYTIIEAAKSDGELIAA
jgi:hypothetical protein